MKKSNQPRAKARLIADHNEQASFHQWVHLGDVVYRDSLGRNNNGMHRWLVFRCNNFDCDGQAIVKANELEEIASDWIEGISPQPRADAVA